MLPAFDAILGHKSAHSLETGPVMAEPFISPWKISVVLIWPPNLKPNKIIDASIVCIIPTITHMNKYAT